jgi:RNA polymerase sigma factor (sigma-70 family)
MAGRLARSRQPAEALRDVYRDNVDAVYAFFTYSVGHETAEDLTAATFERVVRSWDRFDPKRAGARTWILAIARNILTDHFRRESHRKAVSLDEHPALAASLASSDDPAARYLSTDTVREWLRGLEPRERELLALRFGADLPASEIARALDLTEANVHQIASRALHRLHAQLSRSELTGSA